MRTCTAGSTWRASASRLGIPPARICWVGSGLRHKLGLAFNEMVRRGELKPPVVIGRDHLDFRQRGLAQPRNRSDARRQRRRLRLAAAERHVQRRRRRDLSALHHGGGVGMGYSQHSGAGFIVCDGTEAADQHRPRAVERPGTGVMRHADAGLLISPDRAGRAGLAADGLSAADGRGRRRAGRTPWDRPTPPDLPDQPAPVTAREPLHCAETLTRCRPA